MTALLEVRMGLLLDGTVQEIRRVDVKVSTMAGTLMFHSQPDGMGEIEWALRFVTLEYNGVIQLSQTAPSAMIYSAQAS
jgi:hypothetical protein